MRAAHRVALFAAVAVLASTNAHAQLPTVQQVYEKFATAMGGKAAWDKVVDRAEKGTADFAFANMTGTYERYYSAPNKFHLIMGLPIGKVEQGTDGTIAWNSQPGAPAAKLPADDAAYVNEGSTTGSAFLDPTRFAKVAVVGKEVVDGVDCYKVELTTKSGRPRTDYFEVVSGLRRAQVLKTATGENKTIFKDYRAFEGKQVATKLIQTNAQGDIVITISTVTFTPNDPALFALPAGLGK